jgi:hypothetical protein
LEDDVSAISNTKELFEDQDEKENVVARSKTKLFSPTKEALQAWMQGHCPVVTFAGHYVDSNPL